MSFQHKCVYLLFFLFFTLNSQETSAQEIVRTVKAKVMDSLSGNYMTNLTVRVMENGKWIVIPYSDSQKEITINRIPTTIDKIKFSSVGYREKIIYISSGDVNVDLGLIYLAENSIKLLEVKVKPVRRHLELDSSVFNFADSIFDGSKTTGDVLRLIPGLKIIKNQIFFNGVNITTLNVSNRDFFFNDVDLLLNNLPGYAIEKVEIVQPSNNQKGYINSKPTLNIVLKKGSKNGFIVKSVLGYGTYSRNVVSSFLGRMDSTYQIAISADYNNINNQNPQDLWFSPQPVGIPNFGEIKSMVSRSFKKFNLQSKYLSKNTTLDLLQTTTRIDNSDKGLINTILMTSSISEIKIQQLANAFAYQFSPGSLLSLDQLITKSKSSFSNELSIRSDTSYLIQQLVNRNDGQKLKNSLKYNFRDLEAQNKMLEIEFERDDHNFSFVNGYDDISALDINPMKSTAMLAKTSGTYLFSKNSFISIDLEQHFNSLRDASSSPIAGNYKQSFNNVKMRFGTNSKLLDYTLSLENFNYNFESKDESSPLNMNRFLPMLSLNYSLGKSVKIGGMFSSSASVFNLDQLATLSLNNDFFSRSNNYDLLPVISNNIEFHLERLANNKNLYLNFGSVTKENVAENIFMASSNTLTFENIGKSRSYYLNSRQEVTFTKKIQMSGYFNIVKTKVYNQYTSNITNSTNKLAEANIGFQYLNEPKWSLSLINGYTSTQRFFLQADSEQLYRDRTFNTLIDIKWQIFNNFTFALNVNAQFYQSELSQTGNQSSQLISLLTHYTFGKNKNISSFFRVQNLLNSGKRYFQDVFSVATVQTSEISTLGRYFLAGFSLKFNTIKR